MTMRLAALLSFAAGYIALSFEMLWYRAFSIATMGRAHAFGLLLGGYLAGIAIGSLIARRVCAARVDRRAGLQALGTGFLLSAVLGYLFVPAMAALITVPHTWIGVLALLTASAAGLGATFPLIAQLAIDGRSAVGRSVSYIYVSNLIGSTAGTLLTGLILLDHLGLASLTALLAAVGICCAAGLFMMGRGRRRVLLVTTAAALVTVMTLGAPSIFDRVYERLVLTRQFSPNVHFARVVENRHGVIAVTDDGLVFGAGGYDGMFNTDLHHDDKNKIRRAYAVALFHPAPKRVLIIGLSTGSWAEVIASHPSVEHVTIVEINPGYLRLLPSYPEVSELAHDPRVEIVIDDGRRWLARHPAERFDAIVANTTYNWRANATSLLSAEFLDLVRAHLKDGGVYYYNTTGEPRVQRTGVTRFPYAWRLNTMLAVSDSPIVPDTSRFRQILAAYRLRDGSDSGGLVDPSVIDSVVEAVVGELEARDGVLARTRGVRIITDDNMGTEWALARNVWTY
jgi:spermidine synthase